MKNTKVFFLPCSDFKDINPVDSGFQSCPADFSYGPSSRDYHILHFVVSGKGVLIKNGREMHISASECFVIRSGEIAYYKSDSVDPWTYIWLGFRTSLPLPEKLKTADVFDAGGYEKLFMQIMKLSPDDPQISYFLAEKCWELYTQIMPNNKNTSAAELPQKAKAFIENEYMNDICVAEIAGMLHVDRTVLSKAFKKQNGVSPQEYLSAYRLSAAKRFMKNGGYSLSQIAVMCGYKDYCNFSRMFKIRTGMSPREYVKLCMQQGDELPRLVQEAQNAPRGRND